VQSFSDVQTISRRIGFVPLPLACLVATYNMQNLTIFKVLRVFFHLIPSFFKDAFVAIAGEFPMS